MSLRSHTTSFLLVTGNSFGGFGTVAHKFHFYNDTPYTYICFIYLVVHIFFVGRTYAGLRLQDLPLIIIPFLLVLIPDWILLNFLHLWFCSLFLANNFIETHTHTHICTHGFIQWWHSIFIQSISLVRVYYGITIFATRKENNTILFNGPCKYIREQMKCNLIFIKTKKKKEKN